MKRNRRLNGLGQSLGPAALIPFVIMLSPSPASAAIQPVPDPFGMILHPVAIAQTEGDVTNANALLTGHGQATLTMTAGGKPPVIVLDFGRDVGGLPVAQVTSVGGTPLFEEIFSEARNTLFPDGDGASGFANIPGDSSRRDLFALARPGTIVNRQIQGGERYEAITLTSPGSVRLGMAGIKSTTADPRDDGDTGHFAASDPLLTQIWNLGARALQLCETPAGSLPPLLSLDGEGLVVAAAPLTLYQFGSGWNDYTATVEAKLQRNEASFAVAGAGFGAISITLDADNDRLGAPNRLVVSSGGMFGATALTTQPLPIDLKPGTWHRLSVTLDGTNGIVSLDGRGVSQFSAPGGTGTVGFAAPADGSAVFRNLSVTGRDGRSLLRAPLNTPDTLGLFAAGINRLPAILDGAKRDRVVWLGDLGVSGDTVYYTSGENSYVSGSLELLDAFQQPAGEISSDTTPLLSTSLATAGTMPAGAGFYSLPYSIYFVNAAYDYLLYTGDRSFVQSHWPSIKREMAYLAANTDSSGLLVTNRDNGMDWALDTQTGAGSAYNAIYAEALRNAAAMARMFGEDAYGQQLASRAAVVVRAVNARLFDRATGVYDTSTTHRGSYAQDSNVLAVLYGIAAPADAAGILHRVHAKLDTANGPLAFSDGTGITAVISPFMSAFDVYARFETGDDTGALDLIRQVWGRMVGPSGHYSGATWEALGPDGMTQMVSRTLSHGWSSGPTVALSKYVLGVRPTSPGFATWLVRPEPGALSWARGQVPTPHGPITVSWKLTPGGKHIALDLTVPSGTRGTVGIPLRGSRMILVNGRPGPSAPPRGDGYGYLANVTAGTYHVEAAD